MELGGALPYSFMEKIREERTCRIEYDNDRLHGSRTLRRLKD
jgi:hypothetical protein